MREFADWCNLDLRHLAKLEGDRFGEFRAQIGAARISIQHMVAYVPEGADRDAVAEAARRRFGFANPVIGGGPELVDHFAKLAERGVERVYTWFCDFAPPETVASFGATVIEPLRARL